MSIRNFRTFFVRSRAIHAPLSFVVAQFIAPLTRRTSFVRNRAIHAPLSFVVAQFIAPLTRRTSFVRNRAIHAPLSNRSRAIHYKRVSS